jgi:DNA uptake protein ComE-like DNA-binding protein
MSFLKPHFWYHKSQRKGVLFLVSSVLLMQAIFIFVDFSKKEIVFFEEEEVVALQVKIDSLKKAALKKKKQKRRSFNPNYLTDYKAAKLGMSIDEIDRLLLFRKQHKFINSIENFKQVTLVSDSLLDAISPYFKFPDWVVKSQKRDISKKRFLSNVRGHSNRNFKISTTNLNKATIKKINVNTASFKEILSTPYVTYDLCKKIVEYRAEVAELQAIEELKNIEGFPMDKYDRIALYLEAK